MGKVRTVHAFSAGGVLFRRVPADEPDTESGLTAAGEQLSANCAEVVLVGKASECFWVLPKGTPQDGESAEQVALREVEEETGIRGRIIGDAGVIRYWFMRQGVRYDKEVRYYLMVALEGDVRLHDHEYDDAQWFPLDLVPRLLTHMNESALIEKVRLHILQHLATGTDA
jgi:8-oxo-dGTP pyrophosphatase MutT (NUDIX family)